MTKRKALVALLLTTVLSLCLIWFAGSFLTKPVPHDFGTIPSEAQQVEFKSESQSLISGWLYDVEKPIALCVLMHGIRSNRGQMVARAKHLQQLGIASLVFDFQAHGESTGEIITLGYLEALDAQAALQFMSEKYSGLQKIVIGVSMGGAAAIMAKPQLNMDALIIESVYPDIETAIANRLRKRIPGGQYLTPLLALQIEPRISIPASELSPVNHAKQIQVPTLVLSGENDTRTTADDTRALFESFLGPKQLYLFEGAGHDDLEAYNSELYWSVVEPFISEHVVTVP